MAVSLVVAVGALAGVLLAARPSLGNATAAAATASPSPSAHAGRHGGMGFGGGGFDFAPGTGTVTGINGTTLTLRTLRGTLTVDTTPATTYSKEGKSFSLKDIKVDDVVQVRPVRPSGSSTPPASPPTTVTAQSIAVVVPAFFGRVESVSGPTIFIVTRDGQLAYVYTTGGTAYTSNGNAASFSDVKPGDYITAQGTETGVKHLTADRVVITTNPVPGPGGGFFGRPHGGPRTPASPTAAASGSAT
jgi:hypothetical protein